MSPAVQQLARNLGVSADGCRTKQDVKEHIEMLRSIAKGWEQKRLINPHKILT